MKRSTRIIPVIASIAIQLCVGIAYLWSIFQTGIAQSIFGGDNAAASLTFSMMLFVLTVGSVAGGKLAARFSTRAIVIIGGVIISAGFFAASFVTAQAPWLLWLTYGVMGGIGMGFTYSTTIACAQKWYPDKKGLVTGLVVAALGFGGVIFTPIIEELVKTFGGPQVGEFATFRVLSAIFLVVCTVGGLFLKDPHENAAAAPDAARQAAPNDSLSLSPKQVLKNPRFYMLTVALMLACMGGLMMIGFAKPIAVAKGMAETATIGVLVISLCNSAGRLLWGMISDKIGRFNVLFILLAGSAICSLLVNVANGYLIYVLIGCIGFFYGGFLSNFPALTADLFGPKHMATNYGMVLCGFGIGAVVSSYIAGYYKNLASQDISLMFPAFIIAAVSAAACLLIMAALRASVKKKRTEG